MADRKSDPEPVMVMIHMPWRDAGGYDTVEIRIDKPHWRFIAVEMAFNEFWKAVLKLAARPGKMTQWVEADDG